MPAEAVVMRERLGRALTLLQATAFPVDLADNPTRTGQWLITLGNLQQILQLLQGQSSRDEGRASRLVRLFNRMIEGLPISCLSGLPATAKLGLLRPLLTEIEATGFDLNLPIVEIGIFQSRLRQCRAALAAMAARQQAPDPPTLLAGTT
jgi:hypothetical protein